MMIISKNLIELQAKVTNKEDAIKKCGQLLVVNGCVMPEYIKGMLAREAIMSTYLGNGISIPHGEFDNITQIIKTGISVLQIPAGVEWEDGKKAYLIIGIAAKHTEHVTILANLAEVIEDKQISELLISTTDKQVILDHLNKET